MINVDDYLGVTPQEMRFTGAPVFDTAVTASHASSLMMLVMQTPNGLPVGARLLGRTGQHAPRLDTAASIAATAVFFAGAAK